MTDLPAFTDLTTDARPAPGRPFDRALRMLLDDLFAALPTLATSIGYHAHDDSWPDLSEVGRKARLELYARHAAALEALPDGELSADEAIDRGIALEALDGLRFESEVLRSEAWDPLTYVLVLGSGLHELLAREFAPWRHRGTAFLWRARRLPEVLDAARANLVGLPGRPVALLHTETAIEQLPGITTLVDEALDEARRQAGPEAVAILEGLDVVRGEVVAAVNAFRGHLEDVVRPLASGEGRLGPDLFAAKLRHALSSDLSVDGLRARAERDFQAVRAELIRVARGLWPDLHAGARMPPEDDEVVRQTWLAVAARHPAPDGLLDFCRRETETIETFVRDVGLIGLPDAPLRITWTPEFMRPYGGAFLSPPGPLDRGLVSEFWITPPDPDWSHERLESYLREENDRMLRVLCIHEAIPGHYLQLDWSNRTPSLARAVFQSGMFAEGWAVYITQVMMDVGYGADDPALMLAHWKYYLRCVTNTLLDIGIHVDGMSEADAMALMVEGAFQEEQEARAKYLRGRLSSTQLSTYYVGSLEMWDLDLAARRRAADGVGAGTDAVVEPVLVGGLGETPGFDRRAHLEAVISHGSPPIHWVRSILLGDEVATGR
ncbi:MAG: DUF885 domain-containing protein [Candidatus Limnocylindrales bacterium]